MKAEQLRSRSVADAWLPLQPVFCLVCTSFPLLGGTLPHTRLLPCLQNLALVLTLLGAILHLLSPLPQAFQNLTQAWATA